MVKIVCISPAVLTKKVLTFIQHVLFYKNVYGCLIMALLCY